MRIVPKDVIRFGVPSEGAFGPAAIEVRIEPDRFDGWRARATMVWPDPPRHVAMARVFRAKDRNLAAGKMVDWIRRRHPRSWPLANRCTAPAGEAEPTAPAGVPGPSDLD